jgi:hypothetical protein
VNARLKPAIQLVPVLAELGAWGVKHRVTTPRLRVRAELLADGGPAMWEQFMDELREVHLGTAAPERPGPAVRDRLARVRAEA